MRTKLNDLTPMEDRRSRATTKSRQKSKPVTASSVRRWAFIGVGLTLALSGWLNGMAFSLSASHPVNGWVLGLAIPAMVLVFSRVSAILWSNGNRILSYAGAVATLSILLLSVQHCAVSISRLTGEPVALAALFALSLDAGLVVCEVATVQKRNRN